MMKKQKSCWWQPEGWMVLGSYVAIGLVVLYLVFVVARFVVPRIRNIQQMYNSARVERQVGREWHGRMAFWPPPRSPLG